MQGFQSIGNQPRFAARYPSSRIQCRRNDLGVARQNQDLAGGWGVFHHAPQALRETTVARLLSKIARFVMRMISER
jgi:hypothetical protein